MKMTHIKKSVTASTSTRDRISYLEEQIAVLEDRINNGDYADPEEMIDDKLALDELRDELNFAWQDDEAEYNYALQQQEFNPDGSLKGYDDYYDDTCNSTTVTASSEWAADWSARLAPGARKYYYVLSVPTGVARVTPNDYDGTSYHVEVKWRGTGETAYSDMTDRYECMDWAENLLFNQKPVGFNTKVMSNTQGKIAMLEDINASEEVRFYFPQQIVVNNRIYDKLYEHDGGGCYYRTKDPDANVMNCEVSVYPDGRVTTLWNGLERHYTEGWEPVESSIECATSIEAAELVDNDKIQVGLQYDNDGHRFEVKSISKDGKKCKVTEEWISEDTGKEVKKTYTYVIESDADGREYMYDPNYADYKDEWWCKKYAQGADNYPFDWDMRSEQLDKHYAEATKHKDEQLTLGEALDAMQASADAGDEYHSVKVIVDDNQTIYSGYSLEEAKSKLKKYLDYDAKYHWVDYDITIWLYSEYLEDEEDHYTPSATRGDYSPSNPWDAPGMSIHDFI